MGNKTHIDDLFKEELSKYAETPPAAVWDALEKRLGNMPPVKPKLAHRIFHLPHYFFIGTAVIALSTAVAVKFITNHSSNIRKPPLAIATPATSLPGTNSNEHKNVSNKISNDLNEKNHEINRPVDNIADQTKNTIEDKTEQSKKENIENKAAYNKPGVTLVKKNTNTSLAAAGNNDHNLPLKKIINNKSQHKQSNLVNRSSKANKDALSLDERTSKKAVVSNFNSGNTAPAANDIYSSSNNTSEKMIQPTTITLGLNTENTLLPGTFKENSTAVIPGETAVLLSKTEQTLAHTKLSKFEFGIKSGYEGGVINNSAKKVVVSPYVQYTLSDKFSLMLQPAIKYAHLSPQQLSGTQSFYKENKDSAVKVYSVPIAFSGNDSFESVVYSQTHDSIVKSYSTGGTYMEFELPVLLKYALSKKCSIYGGFTASYSAYTTITEHTYNSSPILKTDTTIIGVVEGGGANVIVHPVNTMITYSGTPISAYRSPLYITPSGGLFRLGYMLGFSYTYNNRWLLDLLLQQSAAKSISIGGYNTTTAFSVPYFRFTLGYRLSGIH